MEAFGKIWLYERKENSYWIVLWILTNKQWQCFDVSISFHLYQANDPVKAGPLKRRATLSDDSHYR